MRMALVSDIHGNLGALESVISDIRERAVDLTVNLGDTVSGPLLPRETARRLMRDGWLTISGNHERQVLTDPDDELNRSDAYTRSRLTADESAWLASFPVTARPLPDVLLCHGTPTSDREYLLEDITSNQLLTLASERSVAARLGEVEAALVACGHSHVPRAVRGPRGQLIVNPGSVGLPAFTAERPQPHVVETGAPDARYAIVERGPQGWTVEFRSVAYDAAAMAALARRRERPDWERALLTGYVRP